MSGSSCGGRPDESIKGASMLRVKKEQVSCADPQFLGIAVFVRKL